MGFHATWAWLFSGETKKRNLLVLIEADKITEETAFAFIYVNMLQFSLW